MSQALILIDIQNDYFAGGRMTLEGVDAAAQNAAQLLQRFRTQGRPLFHVQHLAVQPNATFFIPGTPGAEIHPSVAPRAGELVIQKNFPNAFRDTKLEVELLSRGIRDILIAGNMTHMCIDASVRAAFDLGFQVDLAHDACATRSLKFADREVPADHVQRSFVAALSGTYARTSSTAQLVA